MDANVEWAIWARERQQRVEHVLDGVLPSEAAIPGRLHRAMRYSVLGGGKRVRALLCYAGGELTTSDPSVVDSSAAAVELLHAYSLIHDDLPCMDDDVLRRGKPSCHVAFDQATALLAGDALQALAFEVLASDRSLDTGARLGILARFARAVGSNGMAGGQAIDLDSVGRSLDVTRLETMHRMKTGALIAAAVTMGAGCGERLAAGDEAQLDQYAASIGLAFQVVDDILDARSTAEQLGKTPGKDALQHKPTYVSVLGLEVAQRRAAVLHREARAAIAGFGARARRLGELADWIVLRTR